jgi:phosphoglycolate phosphatase
MTGTAELPPPRAILFDWDNTLADNWAAIHGAMNATLIAMGQLPWTLAQSRNQIKASLRDSFPLLFGERWREAIGIYRHAFERVHLAELREMPAAGAMLVGLRDRGLYLAVVSNKAGRYLRVEAAHLGWTPYFGRLVGAQDAETDKPSVAPVEMALAGSGLERGADIWFVGDADIDMACAVNAGCTPVLLRDRPPGAEEFATGRPLGHALNCAGLADLVAQLRVSQGAEL